MALSTWIILSAFNKFTSLIKGGRATNITPIFCQFDFENTVTCQIKFHQIKFFDNKITLKKKYLGKKFENISTRNGKANINRKWVFHGKRIPHDQRMSDATKKQPTNHLKTFSQSSAGKVSYGTEGDCL